MLDPATIDVMGHSWTEDGLIQLVTAIAAILSWKGWERWRARGADKDAHEMQQMMFAERDRMRLERTKTAKRNSKMLVRLCEKAGVEYADLFVDTTAGGD